jgi:hypothetical protein
MLVTFCRTKSGVGASSPSSMSFLALVALTGGVGAVGLGGVGLEGGGLVWAGGLIGGFGARHDTRLRPVSTRTRFLFISTPIRTSTPFLTSFLNHREMRP